MKWAIIDLHCIYWIILLLWLWNIYKSIIMFVTIVIRIYQLIALKSSQKVPNVHAIFYHNSPIMSRWQHTVPGYFIGNSSGYGFKRANLQLRMEPIMFHFCILYWILYIEIIRLVEKCVWLMSCRYGHPCCPLYCLPGKGMVLLFLEVISHHRIYHLMNSAINKADLLAIWRQIVTIRLY